MQTYFDHEKLEAYKAAVDFAAWATEIIDSLPSSLAAKSQLDRASTSAVLNIAEGNGKFALRDRRRYLDIALGSELECAACLDVLFARNRIEIEHLDAGKAKLTRAVSLLVGLIHSVERRIEM